MADTDTDIITQMILDISDVESKAAKLDGIFKKLSSSSTSAFSGVNDSLRNLNSQLTQTATALNSVTSSVTRAAAGAKTMAQANQSVATSVKQVQAAVSGAASEEQSAISKVNAEIKAQNLAYRENLAALRAIAVEARSGGGLANIMGPSALPGDLEKMSEMMRQYGINAAPMRTFWDTQVQGLGKHLVQFAAWSAAIAIAMAAFEGLAESIHRASEAQKQLVQVHSLQVLNQEAGTPLGPASDQSILSGASRLAAQYGDNINDVTQDVIQWYKVTKDLNNALFLTENAMKLQLASGTDLEDIYRTLTALASQSQGQKFTDADTSTFNLSKTPELLNMVFAAAQYAGAGMNQVNREGTEFSSGMANSAGILLKAFDQDGEALKKLGLNMETAIALNQALITTFGNTGGEANAAAEKLSRLVAGYMSLSEASKAGAASKVLGTEEFDKLKAALDAIRQNSDLEPFAKWYEDLGKVNIQARNVLDLQVGSNRQYAVQGATVEAIATKVKDIKRAEEDRNALQRTSQEMMQTFDTSVKRLQGEWSSVAQVIGGPLLSSLASALQMTGDFLNALMGIKAEMGAFYDNGKGLRAGLGLQPYSGWNQIQNRGEQNNQELYLLKQAFAARGKQLSPENRSLVENMIKYQNGADDINGLLFTTPDANAKTSVGNLLLGGRLNQDERVRSYEQQFVIDHPEYASFKWQGGAPNLPGQPGTVDLANPAGGGAGAPKDYANDSTQLQDLRSNMEDYIATLKDSQAVTEDNIHSLERHAKAYGLDQQTVDALDKAHQSHISELTKEDSYLNTQEQTFRKASDAAMAHAKAVGLNTAEGKGWADVARQAASDARNLEQAMRQNRTAIEADTDAIDENHQALMKQQLASISKTASTQTKTAEEKEKTGRGSIDSIAAIETKRHADALAAIDNAFQGAAHASQAYKDAVAAENDEHERAVESTKSLTEALRQELQTKTEAARRSLADAQASIAATFGANSDQIAYYKEVAALIEKITKDQEEYKKAIAQAAGDQSLTDQVNGWYATEQAANAAALAAAKYKEQAKEIESNPFWKGMNAALDTLSSGIGQSVSDSLFGVTATNHEISDLNKEIQLIEDKKSASELYYSFARYHSLEQEVLHKNELAQMDNEIKKLKQKEQALKDSEQNKSVLVKAGEAFVKTTVSDIAKNYQKQLEDSILGVLLGGKGANKNPQIDQMNAQLQNYVNVTVGAQRDNMQAYTDATQAFAQATNSLIDALTGGTSSGGFSMGGMGMGTPSLLAALPVLTGGSLSLSALGAGGAAGGGIFSGGGGGGGSFASTLLGAATLLPAFASGSFKQYSPVGNSSAGGYNYYGGNGGGLGGGLGAILSGGAGGFGNILEALGGGGTPLGLLTAGGGLLSSILTNPNKAQAGNMALGSLAGVGGAIALQAAMTSTGLGGALGAFAAAGPAGWAILLGAGLLGGAAGGMFGPHLNAHDNPDIMGNPAEFGQAMANFEGAGFAGGVESAYTAGSTPYTEDSSLAKQLGGTGEEEFIANFIKSNPAEAAKILTPQELQYFTGATGGISNFHQGNVTLNGNGQTAYWQDLVNAATDATTAIENFKNGLNNANSTIVSLNMFGASSGFFPYNNSIPGYEFPANPTNTGGGNTGVGTGGSTGGDPGDNPPPRKGPIKQPPGNRFNESAAYRVPNTGSGIANATSVGTINTVVQLDGRTIARSTQSYSQRAAAGGYNQVM